MFVVNNENIAGNFEFSEYSGHVVPRETVFDELLDKIRSVIEQTNAWLDAFKVIQVCFETNDLPWEGLLLPAFSIILLRRL